MNIHHLHIFTVVYRQKSFTKAARQINISQPTVSEHIKNLEGELECRLFDRIGKAISPTTSAKILYPKAIHILEEVTKLKSELLGGEDVVKGDIAFGASTIPSTYILPLLVKRFREEYPDIFFQIQIEDSQKINQLIIENDLFCGIVGAKMDENSLYYEPFFKDELCLVSLPQLIRKKTISFNELGELPFLQRERGSGTRKAMEENFKSGGFALKKQQIVAELGSTASVKEAIKQGLGVAVISRLAVQDEIDKKRLSVLSIENRKMERFFYLVRHKNRTLPSHYLRFLQFLRNFHQNTEKS